MQARQWVQCISLIAAVCCAAVSGQEQHTLDLTSVPACYTILHNTGPVGCHSIETQATAPLVTVNSATELDAFVAAADKTARSILLHGALFNPTTLGKLQQSGRCSGVLVAAMAAPPASASPAPSYPYCPCGQTTGCTQQWNPGGTDMLNQAYNFPVVLLNASATALLQKQAKSSAAPAQYPEHVVEMRYQMDVFSGYKLVGGAWFEVQTHTQCCPKCTPDCGGACCDRKGGFQCMVSDDTGGGGGGGSGWDKPTCAKEGGPNSFSCIDQGTCLPLGGFNVWSLGVDAWPPPQGKRIVVAVAAMDGASMFHDATHAAADASALVGLIAATDALRGVREEGGAAIMTALVQGEAWDNVGSRRLFHDMLHFTCRKWGTTTGGGTLCLEPLMLAPQIQEVNVSNVGFVLEVGQLGAGVGGAGGGEEVYVHTGCSADAETSRLVEMMIAQPASVNASKMSRVVGPLPPPSALHASVRGSEDPAVARLPGALLTGYKDHFATPYYHSHWDAPRKDAPLDIPALCRGATTLARSLYLAAYNSPPPTSLSADCKLVGELASALLDPTSPSYKGPAYTGVYLPPTRRGPSAREKYIRHQLALASRSRQAAACDCCAPSPACHPPPFHECLLGECVSTVAVYHDAYGVGLGYKRGGFYVANRSVAHQIWTESNWQNNVGANGYLLDSPFNEQVVVGVGALLTIATGLVTTLLLNYYNTHFKQN